MPRSCGTSSRPTSTKTRRPNTSPRPSVSTRRSVSIPADSDLRKLTLDLLSGGVVGFYRNDEGSLYVLSKAKPGVNERFTFAHEYDHALQDQNFSVFRDQKGVLDQGDRLLARQAVYEGDATLLMTQWASANLDQAELLELVKAEQRSRGAGAHRQDAPDPEGDPRLPLHDGARLGPARSDGGRMARSRRRLRRGCRNRPSRSSIPRSTPRNEAPVAVTLPADLATQLGTGWTVPLDGHVR